MEWGVGSGKWSGEWQVEWGVAIGVGSGKWSGEWQVASGKRQVEWDQWAVGNGEEVKMSESNSDNSNLYIVSDSTCHLPLATPATDKE